MKHLLPLAFVFTGLQLWAQYSSPESVEYDAARNRYIVASTNGGGNLYSVVPGSAPVLFTAAVSSPYGLCIVGDSVYVCDASSYIKVFNLVTGAAAGSINTGGSFLNGICTDFAGNIYATDFSAKTIYRMSIATQQFNLYVANTVKTPNGIVYDSFHNRLVVATWNANASLLAVNMSDSTITTIKTTTITSFDGVTMDEDGNCYTSAWQSGAQGIYFFDSALVNAPQKILTFANGTNAADISYNVLTDTLAVPNTGLNTVTFYGFPRPVAVDDVDSVCVDSAKTICLLQNDYAANNTPLLFDTYTSPTKGTAGSLGNCLSYTANAAGNDTIRYTVCTNDTPSFCRSAQLIITNTACTAQVLPPVADFTVSRADYFENCFVGIYAIDTVVLYNTSQSADSIVWSVTPINSNVCSDSILNTNSDSISLYLRDIWKNCMEDYFQVSVCLTAFNVSGSNTKCDSTCYIIWESITELPLANIHLYPTPTNHTLTIDMQRNSDEVTRTYSAIEIINSLGQVVETLPRSGSSQLVQLSVGHLPAGLFTAALLDAKGARRTLGRFQKTGE